MHNILLLIVHYATERKLSINSGTVNKKGGQAMRTADQLGRKLKVSARYVRKLAENGKIPFVYGGPRALRFDEKEVMAAHKRAPKVEPQESHPA
jgi:excisionase family DNA binding protein